MTSETAATPVNARADARNNRVRILAAATLVLSRDGQSSTLSSIAEEAGVGIGTLYRHFPNRGLLVEAVYRDRVTDLCDAAADLLSSTSSPFAALTEWLGRFAEMLVDNHDVPEALKPSLSSDSGFREESSSRLNAAATSLLDASRARNEVRTDVDAVDVLRIATGLAYATPNADETRRLLGVVLDGLQPPR